MRLVLAPLLLLAATSAWAEWVKVAETPEAVFYVEPATIRSSDNLRQAWELQDYPKPEANGAHSRRALREFDCAGQRVRRLSVAEHSEPMGGGKIVNASDAATDWAYIGPRTGTRLAPSTPILQVLRFVCSR